MSITDSFLVITLSNKVQFSHPGTVLETRGQELSFGTKNYGILGFTDRDITLKVLTKVIYPPLYLLNLIGYLHIADCMLSEI